MGKARKMAAEFQGQFQEAMREAEMADLKKSFDEVREAATGLNPLTSLQKDVSDALRVDALDKPAETSATTVIDPPATPTTPEAPTPETFVEAEAHAAVTEPLAITREVEQAQVTKDPVVQDTAPSEAIKDAKAS
jgi:sec-independent protein translocase protein TatB